MKWQLVAVFGLLCACTGPTEETEETGDTGADETGVETDSDTDTDTSEPEPLTVIGDWAEIGGAFPDNTVWGYHTIDAGTWADAYGASYTITQYDNDTMFAIAQNGSGTFNPDMWSRFDWAPDGADGWYYCQTAFAAEDEATALATPRSDDSAPATGGCGGMFAWSHLQPTIPAAGTWDDGFAEHLVDEANWAIGTDVFHVKRYDVDARFAIAQNDAANAYNPSLWSRFDWHVEGSTLSYCQSAYAATTEEAAAIEESDHGDLATGCGGFPWSTLTPIED